jgi:glycosyltransferase involved in cell wall biosynthesis
MNWVFLDFIRWDYDIAAPRQRPLGGSQSALCYLAAALARRGQRVTTLTGTTKPREVDGVRCLRYEDIPAEVFAPADTVTVVLNGPVDVGQAVRQVIPKGKLLVLWTQHAHDQPAMKSLADPKCVELWDRIVCLSDWQREMFRQHFPIPLDKIDVLRNAISPLFANMFASADQLAAAKSAQTQASALRLAYTSTPFRGLAVLLASFPPIRRRHPTCTLDVFSSMQVYGQALKDDPYTRYYDQCRQIEGINYHGSVSQPQLAKALAGATMLAYPNTFAETSCIAVMEALAAGLLVITSDLGALPETCAGWARLVAAAAGSRSQEQFAVDFTRQVIQSLQELEANPTQFFRQRFEQSQAINASCTWDIRAAEWEKTAAEWLSP